MTMVDLSQWVGREEIREDRLDPARSAALFAALDMPDRPKEGDPLPPLHHWLFFWDVPPPAETKPDGHSRRFLPPVPLPRRMWAGGEVRFEAPLLLGDDVRRRSRIEAITEKRGRTGTLIFVTVRHELHGRSGLAIVERQDLVFREPGHAAPPAPDANAASDRPAGERLRLEAGPLLLFRYSALTMNSHRIHYDHPYVTLEEGYPGLVIHGPLQATFLAALAERELGRSLASFSFRGVAPAIAGHLSLCSNGAANFWVEQNGRKTMTAEVSA